jgi:hypothetical protein
MAVGVIGQVVWFALGRRPRVIAPKISPYSDTNHDVPLIDAIWRVFMGVWDEGHKVEMGDDPNRYPVLD